MLKTKSITFGGVFLKTDIFTIIDPINYKKYIIDPNEIKNWLDVTSLKYLLINNKQAKDAFNRMLAEEKEAILSFIDRHEDEKCFNPKKWLGLNGVELDLDFCLKYDSSSIFFYDEINTRAKDKAFFSKNIYTISRDGEIKLSNTIFPIKTMWAFSDDFIKTEELNDEDLKIFFKGYFGDETNGNTKVIINQQSQSTPIHFSSIFKKEECWLYELNLTFVNEIHLPNIMWYGIPSIKKLYDFFYANNFSIHNNNTKITEWHRDEDIIQYFHTPEHFYEPFLLIKQHKGNKDVSSRNKLGTSIFNAMQRSGLLEDIYLYKGNNYLNNALDALTTTNKMNADLWLTDAIKTYELCVNHNMYEANANTILCKWFKNRLGNLVGNQVFQDENNQQIIMHLLKYRNWNEVLKFLLFVLNLNAKKKINTNVIKNIFPIYELEHEYFIPPDTLNNLVVIWDEEMSKNIPTSIEDVVFWIPVAEKMNAKKTTNTYLKALFKFIKLETNFLNIPRIINDDFFNICLKYNFSKEYISACNKLISFFDITKNNLNFGDLSYQGRKDYRWKSYICYMGKYKFLFHKAYILQQTPMKKQNPAFELYNEAIKSFEDGLLFLDLSENYSEDQLDFIIDNFLSLYNLGIITKNDSVLNSVNEYIQNVWKHSKNYFVYKKINSILPNKVRDKYAMKICTDWKKNYGSEFYEKKEILPDLIYLYISTEEWQGATDSLLFALTNYIWSFDEFEELYKLYKQIKQSVSIMNNIPDFSEIEQRLQDMINVFLEETQNSQKYINTVLNKVLNVTTI